MPTQAAPASKSSPARNSNSKSPLLESRRLYELMGFLLGVAGLLALLSLVSYQPQDPSLNTVSGEAWRVNNWVGFAGSYTADILFQGLGWVAYLVPLTLFVV